MEWQICCSLSVGITFTLSILAFAIGRKLEQIGDQYPTPEEFEADTTAITPARTYVINDHTEWRGR